MLERDDFPQPENKTNQPSLSLVESGSKGTLEMGIRRGRDFTDSGVGATLRILSQQVSGPVIEIAKDLVLEQSNKVTQPLPRTALFDTYRTLLTLPSTPFFQIEGEPGEEIISMAPQDARVIRKGLQKGNSEMEPAENSYGGNYSDEFAASLLEQETNPQPPTPIRSQHTFYQQLQGEGFWED